ncbi:MAG: hypothetical protein J07HN4v3_00566 [Halonotius sp. J07HN4]|nr:MAG: hypothetical protein J07HN4v3_00566 [Halonotius sp. J07HN4]
MMILPDRPLSSKTKLRVALSVGIVLTVLLVSMQTASASPPAVQIETTTDIDEPMPGEAVEIDATISNLENDNDRNVRVRYVWLREGGGLDAYQQSEDVGVISPGDSLTIPFSMTFDSPGQKHLDLVITASKVGDDTPYEFKKPIYIDVTESDLRGDVRLTSTSVTGSNTVVIEGDAANTGGTDVDSVLLSIPSTDSVSPTPPNGEYYVGGVETSEFGTFELTADISNNTDSVPVDITYISTGENRGDERVTKTQQIQLEEQSPAAPQPRQAQATTAGVSSSDSGPPIAIIGVVAALVVIGAIGLMLWRRQ